VASAYGLAARGFRLARRVSLRCYGRGA
jgi:hypothetical protein